MLAFNGPESLPTGLVQLLDCFEEVPKRPPPLELVFGASTAQLSHAPLVDTGQEVLLGHPKVWLHQQLSVELAVALGGLVILCNRMQ